jgi:metallophosphoesterase superfamily enzyme
MVTQEYFEELKDSMAQRSVESLVAEFNQQVGRRAWTSIRGLHDSVLIDTLIDKGVDVTAVYDGVTISFQEHVVLNEDLNKLILVK